MPLTHVGSFQAPTTTGSQTITGCGFTPSVVIFWGYGSSTEWSWISNIDYSIGVTTDASHNYSIGGAGQNGVTTSVESRRSDTEAFSLNWEGTIYDAFYLDNFTSDGFTIGWATVNPYGHYINYLAIGGTDITNATIKDWVTNTGTGNQAVTGVGFRPDCVIHLGVEDPSAPAHTAVSQATVIGAMDAAGDQWAVKASALNGETTMSTARWQKTNRCLIGGNTYEAHFVSMDSGGFTVDFDANDGYARHVFSLCMKGGSYLVGNWAKGTGAAPQYDTVTTTGLTPTGVLFITDSYAASSSPQAGMRLSVGASDGTNRGTMAWTDKNGVGTTVCKQTYVPDHAILVADNDTGTTQAEGNISNRASGSFTFGWDVNSAVATQICYVAFGTTLITSSSSETATLTVAEAHSLSSGITASETATITAHDVPTLAVPSTSTESATLTVHEADSASSGAFYVGGSTETATISADETATIPALTVSSSEAPPIVATEQATPLVSGNLFVGSSEVDKVNAVEYQQVARTKAPPGLNGGTGRLWFGGVDITEPPYYAGMTLETKYGFLDGYTSQQYTTSPNKLVITRPYAKDWLRHVVLRSIAPDNSRQTLMNSIIALGEVFDPTNGPQQLMFEEYIGSYFIAQSQTSILNNEAISAQMTEFDIDLACTGPAYSVEESEVIDSLNTRSKWMTITSNGDVPAWPCWRVYCGGPYEGSFSITNETTGEVVTWTGKLNFGDYIDFIMDEEYGTPYTIFINGTQQALSGFSGPAWPHLVPGDNTILFTQLKSRQNFLIDVRWRDRFEVGQTEYPTPPPLIPPVYRIPVQLTINAVDNPALANSYLLSGTLLDVYGDAVSYAPINITYSVPIGSWAPGAWYALGTTTTDQDGNWVLPGTAASTNDFLFRAYYAGDATHTQEYSSVIRVARPAGRVTTTLTFNMDGDDPEYTVNGTYKDPSGNGIANASVGLFVTTNSIKYGGWYNSDADNYWRLDPHATINPVTTDVDGNYSFNVIGGCANPWGVSPRWYHTYTQGTMTSLGAWGLGVEISETASYTPQEPQPIEYQIMLCPEAITNGVIQYFAANGYTTCYCIAYPGTSNLYENELAAIKALGMKPILDIESVTGNTWGGHWSGTTWVPPNYTIYNTYFGQLRDAGWEICANEAGYDGCVGAARQYFSGYVNYHISDGEMTFGYSEVVGTPPVTYQSPTVAGIYMDEGTTANVWECYNDDMVWRAIMPGTDAGALLGIPGGILAGAWSNGNAVWTNSLANLAPIPGENTSTGNTYQSILDWSYTSGVGLSYWGLDYMWPAAIYSYFDMGFDTIVTNLQASYPPSGTNALIPPTILAVNATLNETKNNDGTYTINGQLTELVSQNPLVDAPVRLDISVDNVTWAPVAPNPTYTDASGSFAWDTLRLGDRPRTTLASQALSGQDTLVVTSATGFIGYHSKYDGSAFYSPVDSNDSIAIDPTTFIQFYNGSGTDDTVTFSASEADVHGNWWCQTCILAAGGELLLGPFDTTKYGENITVTHSYTTDVVMATFSTAESIEPTMLVYIGDGTNAETQTIQSINGNTITLTGNLANTYAIGAEVAGEYRIRAYYEGDATHLPFYAPYGFSYEGMSLGVP